MTYSLFEWVKENFDSLVGQLLFLKFVTIKAQWIQTKKKIVRVVHCTVHYTIYAF